MSAGTSVSPGFWKYALIGVVLFILLVPMWVVLLQLVIQPEPLMNAKTSMVKRALWWFGFPLIVIIGALGFRWQMAASAASAANVTQASPVATHLPNTNAVAKEQAEREYALEIIGLGVTLDKYRQGALWDVLKQGHAFATIRDTDPKSYPWSRQDKAGVSGGRAGSTLENAITPTPMYWVAPAFFAGPPNLNPDDQLSDTNPTIGLAASTRSAGLSWNMFAAAGWIEAEKPDRLLERVFAIFDKYPDLPYVVVSSFDDLETRERGNPAGSPPLLKDGRYMPEMPDSSAMFVLARRERVDSIRPFAFDDVDEEKVDMNTLNRRGVARRVFLAHSNLEKSVPQPQGSIGRAPTVSEWLDAAAAFAKQAGLYDTTVSLLHPFENVGPPKDFKPTPWFPVPWNKVQLAAFDKLPTLGYLHRPVFVKTTDENGKPLSRSDARAAALATGWQQALMTLPEADRTTAPARVITATGGNVEQTVALTSMLNGWSGQGGPEIDPSKVSQWINTDARLGNTGAATWFVQMAIGVMGSYRDDGVSAAINLRDPSEASIIFITPPTAAQRKRSGEVFGDNTTPAVDPANYKQP